MLQTVSNQNSFCLVIIPQHIVSQISVNLDVWCLMCCLFYVIVHAFNRRVKTGFNKKQLCLINC